MLDPVVTPFEGARAYPASPNLGGLLLAQAQRLPRARALHFMGGESWSWSRLAEEAGAIQAGLARRGIGPGDHVALMCDNSLRMAASLCAVTGMGAVAIPVNTALVERGLSHVIMHSDAKLLIGDAPHLTRCVDLNAIDRARCVATDDAAWRENFGQPSAFVAQGEGADPAIILYTSGTTGEAKGVMLSHTSAVVAATAAAAVLLEATPQSVIYSSLPLFHCAAQQLGLWAALASGAQFVISPRFSASTFWSDIRSCGATAFHFVGPMTSMLWNAPRADDDAKHPPLIAVGGGPRIAWNEFEKRFNVEFVESYGMTETFGACVSHRPHRGRDGTVGKALEHVEVVVADDAGKALAPGEVGQVLIRPIPSAPPHVLFSGYYKRPDLTEAALRDGWYQTGDLGRMDGDGFLTYQSRARDIIRRRGENVSALEVEAAAMEHPGVAECGVVGVPSELGEEDILAVLVSCDAAAAPALPDVAAFLAAKLPFFAMPRYLCFAGELPKTATGRIQRHLLRPLKEGAYEHKAASRASKPTMTKTQR